MSEPPNTQTQTLTLWDGTLVPWVELVGQAHKDLHRGGLVVVFGHGLNDKKEDDAPALQRALDLLPANFPDGTRPRAVVYDARGHGQSSGWELQGPAQFHWRSLAVDMLQLTSTLHGDPGTRILGGYSMGANSALWAALLSPRLVSGLVLLSCTTAWELRAGRRSQLLENAEKKRQEDPAKGELFLGAARADLPPKEELAVVSVPALILSARDDPVHPAAMAETLAEVLPKAKLVLVDTKAELLDTFSVALADWLQECFRKQQ